MGTLLWGPVGGTDLKPKSTFLISCNYTASKFLDLLHDDFSTKLLQKNLPALSDVIVPHYLIKETLKKNGIFIGGRPKGSYCAQTGYTVPIMVFFNKKTLKTESLNLSKEDLRAIVFSTIFHENMPITGHNVGRYWTIYTGAIVGSTKKGISNYTNIPYSRVKQTSENPKASFENANFIRDLIIDDNVDFVFVPYPLNNMFFHTEESDAIGIATVEGKMPNDLNYPIVDYILYVCGQNADNQLVDSVAQILNDRDIQHKLKEFGVFPIEDNQKALAEKLALECPDLYARSVY